MVGLLDGGRRGIEKNEERDSEKNASFVIRDGEAGEVECRDVPGVEMMNLHVMRNASIIIYNHKDNHA